MECKMAETAVANEKGKTAVEMKTAIPADNYSQGSPTDRSHSL